MAKKKSEREISVSRKVRNKSVRSTRKVVASQRKINLVISNLIFFVILFVASLGLYYVSSAKIWLSFFWMISLITGLLALTFLIIYLIFWVLKIMKK